MKRRKLLAGALAALTLITMNRIAMNKKARTEGVAQVKVEVTVEYSGDELSQGQEQQVAAAAAQAASAKVGEYGGEVLSAGGVIIHGDSGG